MNKHLTLSKADVRHDKTTFILGHCRFDTKGSPDNKDNNHPIVVGKTIGVHNRVIINDDDVYDSFKYCDKFPKRIARVDSEIIFALIDYYHTKLNHTFLESIQRVEKELTGGYACAAVNTSNPCLMALFRKSNPIYVEHLHKAGLILFASEVSMILESVEEVGFGIPRSIPLDLDEIMLIDTRERAYSVHPLHAQIGGSTNVHC
jgi:glucosamine--fructose-6-phosphate aminotransferase (isomerizing)